MTPDERNLLLLLARMVLRLRRAVVSDEELRRHIRRIEQAEDAVNDAQLVSLLRQ